MKVTIKACSICHQLPKISWEVIPRPPTGVITQYFTLQCQDRCADYFYQSDSLPDLLESWNDEFSQKERSKS